MIETGISFDNIHSFYDLNLILSKVEIDPASPKTTYINIPGADGSLDLTEAHGEVKYSDRKAKFTFTMNPAGNLSETAWEEKKMEVSNRLNGRAFKITLDKDPDYYWQGRCKIDDYKSSKRVRQFVISATLRPYKLKQSTTVAEFKVAEEEQTISILNGRKSVSPSIFCAGNVKIVFNGNVFDLNAGTQKILDIRFTEGVNQMIVSGSSGSAIKFYYQEGEL